MNRNSKENQSNYWMPSSLMDALTRQADMEYDAMVEPGILRTPDGDIMDEETFVEGTKRLLEKLRNYRPVKGAIEIRIDQLYEKLGKEFKPGERIFVKDLLPLGRDFVRKVLATAVGAEVVDEGKFFSWYSTEKYAAPIRFKVGDDFELFYMEDGVIGVDTALGVTQEIADALGFDPEARDPKHGKYICGKYCFENGSFELTDFNEAEEVMVSFPWGGTKDESRGLESVSGEAIVEFIKIPSKKGGEGVDHYIVKLETGDELCKAVQVDLIREHGKTAEEEARFCQKIEIIRDLNANIHVAHTIIERKESAIGQMLGELKEAFFPPEAEVDFDDPKIIALGARVPSFKEFFDGCLGRILEEKTCLTMLKAGYDYSTPLEELQELFDEVPLLIADLISAYEICKTRIRAYREYAPKFAELNESALKYYGNVRVFATSAKLTMPRAEVLPDGDAEKVSEFGLNGGGLNTCRNVLSKVNHGNPFSL